MLSLPQGSQIYNCPKLEGESTLWPFPSQLASLMLAGHRGVRDGEVVANPSPSEDTKKELCSLPRMVHVSLFVKLGVSWSHTSAANLGQSATTQEPPAKHAAKEKLIGRRTLTRCGVSRRHSGKIPV